MPVTKYYNLVLTKGQWCSVTSLAEINCILPQSSWLASGWPSRHLDGVRSGPNAHIKYWTFIHVDTFIYLMSHITEIKRRDKPAVQTVKLAVSYQWRPLTVVYICLTQTENMSRSWARTTFNSPLTSQTMGLLQCLLYTFSSSTSAFIGYWHLTADVKGSDIPSLRSLLVAEERMRSRECL